MSSLRTALFAAALVALVTLFGVSAVGAQESVDDPADIEAGAEIYAVSCAGCHAETGVGSQNGPPLTDAANRQSRADHITLITNGGNGMPGFSERYTPEEIGTVASYVRLSFTEQEAAAQDDDEEALDELPFTGFEENVAFVGLALVLIGGALMLVADRNQETKPLFLRVRARYSDSPRASR